MKEAVWDLKSQPGDYNSNIFDCMVAEFLLCDGRYTPTEERAFAEYKVTSLEDLAKLQQEKLKENPKLLQLFSDIEMPLVYILSKMERNGILLDTVKLRKVGQEIESAIVKVEEKIKKEVQFDINLNSSVQVGNYLAEKVGVPLSKTKTGRYATNETEISKFANQFSIVADLLSYRELSKLRSTYVESLIDKVDESGRVHTSYNQVAVSTGRLSSSNPNMQNIPVTSDFGQKIKSCFVAEKDHIFLSFDYSQQELRILAHLTGEEKLIEAFQTSRDVHKITAGQIFQVPYEEVTKEQRTVGKTINFGIIYGMSSYGLSVSLSIPVDEAQGFIDTFYATYPKIQTYYENYLKNARVHGFVETMLGRRRYVFEYPQQKAIDNSTRRVLMNYPIQGSAADLMKKAMVDVDLQILLKEKDVKLLLQIHDDLVFEVSNDPKIYEVLIEKIRKVMCEVYPLSVPIEVDVKIGENWGEMEKIA